MDMLCWCCLSPAWDPAEGDNTLHRKLTVVGDGACGKTCLLLRITRNEFPEEDIYIPTDFDKDVVEIFRGRRKMQMTLQDSPGQEELDRLRPIAYSEVDVVLLCFSLDSPDSLVNVENIWIQEVRVYCPDVPVILVGNKKDLRDQYQKSKSRSEAKGQKFVTSSEGRSVARRIGASDYVECSAKTAENVKRVLGTAIRRSTL